MEIRTLRYFLAVAREENMTKAAELLHVTQPTLSKALRSLEDELGKKLFERHSFSISLTDEGMLLRDRAEDLVILSDPLSGARDPFAEKSLSEAELSHHQRRHGAGHRKARQGLARFRRAVRYAR